MESVADSSKNSATDQVTVHSAAAADSDTIQLRRRDVNARNALMRIESKVKTKTSQSTSHDTAQDARTVFVGNVALSVNKKVSWWLYFQLLC